MAPPRRRRRTVRRKRTFRRRVYRRRARRYDNGISLKIHSIDSLTYSSTYTHGDFTIQWGSDDTTGGANNYIRLSDQQEFQTYAGLFREYKIVGLSYQYMPIGGLTSGLSSSQNTIWTCNQVVNAPTAAMSDDDFVG